MRNSLVGVALKSLSRSSLKLMLVFCCSTLGLADEGISDLGFEVIFVIDATHSNEANVKFTQQVLGRVQKSVEQFNQQHGERFRIGIVVFRDDGEAFLSGVGCKLSPDFKKLTAALNAVECEGGGDDPDAVTAGLELAVSDAMGWRENSSKHVILVGSSGNNSVGPSITTILERAGDVTEESMAKRARALITLHAVAMHAGKPNKQHVAEFSAIAAGGHGPGIFLQVNERSPEKFGKAVDVFSKNISRVLKDLSNILSQGEHSVLKRGT